MLKNTEAEETVHFVVIIFVIGGISNGEMGRLSPTVPLLATPTDYFTPN